MTNIENNSLKGHFKDASIAFTSLDLENGSGKGYWPLYVEKGWAKVHGA